MIPIHQDLHDGAGFIRIIWGTQILLEEITEKIIKAYYQVYNELGFGFLEKVYENAMLLELRGNGIQAVAQEAIKVYYKDKIVGEYFADIIVNGNIILELKAGESIHLEHIRQVKNYLKAIRIETGFLFNFGSKAEFKRIFLNNPQKNPDKS